MRQSGQLAKYSAAEQARVRLVEFSSFSKEELEAWSVAQIKQTRLYEGSRPTPNGPNDLRLGVNTSGQKCETCGEGRECQGHFGHIKLQEPVFHYGYMKYIEKILKCVCHHCYKLKIFKNDYQRVKFMKILKITNPVKKLNEAAKLLCHISKCGEPEAEEEKRLNGEEGEKKLGDFCGADIPTKIQLRNYKLYVNDKPYDSRKVHKILAGITREDAKALGFTRSKPVNLMIETLAVAPPQIRPSIEMNPQKRAQDDITSAYVRIISLNKEIKDSRDTSDKAQKIQDMERIIASIMVKLDRVKMEKTVGGRKKKVMKQIKSIESRLKGKEGRFRQHLMGKRVDFSARSVVSPDSNLALDQLGVPQKVARSLSVPEEITEWNYERILKLCKEGKIKYLIKPNENKREFENMIDFVKLHDPAQIEKYLNYGMIVERCLQNGDYVLFNRQPTLHRMSMMGHRVRILPYNTFRLNLSVCTPYNADFDGDEMNMHVPQSYQTIAELKHITHVPKQIVAPKNNAPVMGIVQDALLGLYLFSMRDTFLTREEIMNLVIWIEHKEGRSVTEDLLPGQLPMPAILKPQPLWTGKQVMSLIIPDKITIEIMKEGDGENAFRNIKDTNMIIRKGQLLSGALQKEVVGSGPGGLVHSIWLQIGPQATNEFMTTAQRIVNNWLMQNGFTVGASDIVLSEDLKKKISDDHVDIMKSYYDTFNNYRNEKIIEEKTLHQRGKKIMDSFEFNINNQLNSRLGSFQKTVAANVSPYLNNIFKMITAKSKGSETNLAQIMFSLGNQNVDGKRVPLGFAKRALPHFSKDDNSPESRGFVFSSFYRGLKPHEFFFHSMGGREGLSDTAVKTSRTGYIQRKLVKSLEDIVIKYDGTVRDSSNNMLQKLYGQDSFMAEYIEKQKLHGIGLSLEDFKKKFGWDAEYLINKYNYDAGSSEENFLKLKEELDHLIHSRERLREVFILGKDQTEIEYYCPIKFQRLINKIRVSVRSMDGQRSPINPAKVYEQVEKLIDQLIPPQVAREYQELLTKYRAPLSEKKKREFFQKKRQFEKENGLQLFRIHLRMYLSSKNLIEHYKLTNEQIQGLLEEVKTKFYQSLAPAGEAIGSIAAQSIGEPTTQMTLNTFHLAGVADKNVTLGVPRLQQLLDTSKNIKTPNMTIFLKDRIKYNVRKEYSNLLAGMISFHIPQRYIKDFLTSSRIYYDPDPEHSNIGARYKEMSNFKRTPWVMAIEFSNKKLTTQAQWQEIVNKLESEYGDNFEINEETGFGESAEKQPKFTMRLINAEFKTTNSNLALDKCYQYLIQVQQNIRNVFISGIKGIKSVKTSKKVLYDFNHNEQVNKKNKEDYEYVVFQTEGSNLKKCLSHFKIDNRKTYCNDMIEIYHVLGIEAARQSFINEFKQIIKPYGIYINYRHLCVLADWMTTRGILTPVNRNGINRVRDVSILRKASYEETTDILFSAAVFSEIDQMRGVSEKIIFGQNVNIGTGNFNIMIDRQQVSSYNAKGKRDKEEIDDNYETYMNYDKQDFGLGINKTPIINTPGGYGRSMHIANSPNVYATAMHGMKSPLFTPMRSYHNQQFTQEYQPQMSVMHSPANLGGQTPLPFNQISNTPIMPSTSPVYGLGMSTGNRLQSSYIRSPHYNISFGMSTNSPNYSSVQRSPGYDTPGSSNRYGSPSSPIYSQSSPMAQSHRQPYKDEQDDEDNL